jgi:hypothetical protein
MTNGTENGPKISVVSKKNTAPQVAVRAALAAVHHLSTVTPFVTAAGTLLSFDRPFFMEPFSLAAMGSTSGSSGRMP